DPETQPQSVKPILAKMSPITPTIAPVSVPKGLRVISTKSYFLGGMKDATYTARLQEFHTKITERAQQELTELKQITATLDSQLGDTTKKFESVYKKKGRKVSAAQKKAWESFDQKWTTMNQQLAQTFTQITPEMLQNNYFYGTVYLMGQQVAEK